MILKLRRGDTPPPSEADAATRRANALDAHVEKWLVEAGAPPPSATRTRIGLYRWLRAEENLDRLPSRRRRAARARLERADVEYWGLAVKSRGLSRRLAAATYRGFPLLGFDDLASYATTGVYEAAIRYNPDAASSFATYAQYWARAMISRAIENHSTTIRFPGEYRAAHRRLTRARAREPLASDEEIRAEIGVSEAVFERLVDGRYGMDSLDEIVAFEDRSEAGFALDALVAEAEPLDDTLDRGYLAARVAAAVDALDDPLALAIIRARYGLADGVERSLSETARAVEGVAGKVLSRERIRQIEREALRDIAGLTGIASR